MRKKRTTTKRKSTRKNVSKKKYWERRAVEHPGHADAVLRKMYGAKAFYANGEIKPDYLERAIKKISRGYGMKEGGKRWPPKRLANYKSLILARTFKHQSVKHKLQKQKARKIKKRS
jgi:uncharacterized protein YyaL (SSP411 family)